MRKRPFQCWAILRKQPRRGPNGWVVKLGGTARGSARTPELDAVTGDVAVNPWVAVVDVVGTALRHNTVDARTVQVRGRSGKHLLVRGSSKRASGHVRQAEALQLDSCDVSNQVPSIARDTLNLDERVRELVRDRKSTRLNSSHVKISYAVFCLKKKIYLLIYYII